MSERKTVPEHVTETVGGCFQGTVLMLGSHLSKCCVLLGCCSGHLRGGFLFANSEVTSEAVVKVTLHMVTDTAAPGLTR